MTDPESKVLAGHIKVITSEVRALVALLPQHQQVAWLRIHEANCQRMKIDSITGATVDPDIDKSGNAADLS